MPAVYHTTNGQASLPCITVDPLWAWAIMAGYKPVENRTWRTRYRGRLAIHAAAKIRRGAETRAILRAAGIEPPQHVVCGAVLGTVDLTDCRERNQGTLPFGDAPQFGNELLAWGPWCWILADPLPLPEPIPCPGHQGLWYFRGNTVKEKLE